MRWNLGKVFLLAFVLIIAGSIAANAQTGRCCYGSRSNPTCDDLTEDSCGKIATFMSWTEGLDCTTPCEPLDSAWVDIRYETTDFQYETDSTLTIEVWAKANVDIQASQLGFKMNRYLFRIDTLYWNLVDMNIELQNAGYGVDTAVLGNISGFFPPDYLPMFVASVDYKLMATIEMTYQYDSLDLIRDQKVDFTFDSAWYAPAGDFILTDTFSNSLKPIYFGNQTVQLGISKVYNIHPGLIPEEFELGQNYPNPFNPDTKIEFAVPYESFVNLAVYNIMGRRVRTLVDEELDAGWKSVTWDGKDESGSAVASGIYLYKVIAGDFVDSKKMMMLK